MFKFGFGDKVKCSITGFVGVVTVRQEHFNGCLRYTVEPPVDKEGKMKDAYTFDEKQLVLVKTAAVERDPERATNTGHSRASAKRITRNR